ncbi:serine kinase [Gymnodinialimonas hymeniacidonis]|uniref:serine kinase n=1 Tax=Gymnodinialimonas hymeniacidonis TaxID=3126508 RepID=UPI0034C5BEC0
MDIVEPLDPWIAARDGEGCYFNASAVALQGRGVLLLGSSGSGKSSTALGLMAYGAALISDDGVWLRDGSLVPPHSAPCLIEARGIGLLKTATLCPSAPLSLVVVLGEDESQRLPPRRFVAVDDENVPLIRTEHRPTLVPAILQILRHGRSDT